MAGPPEVPTPDRLDPELEEFVAELRSQQDELLKGVRRFLAQTDKSLSETALAIYLDVILERILGAELFEEPKAASKKNRANTKMISRMAAGFVANTWLLDHPYSAPAQNIYADVDAPLSSHVALLKEMWPEIIPKIKDSGLDNSPPEA